MDKKIGRPPFYKTKLIRRVYQITDDQDKAIKKIAAANGESASSVLRNLIGVSILNGK